MIDTRPATSTPVRAYARIVSGLVGAIISTVAIYLFAGHMWQGAITGDWPWLWRSGEWISAQQRIPATDLFSWTLPDQPWLLYQWLFEVLAAWVYDVLGPTGAVIALCFFAVSLYAVVPAWWLARRGIAPVISLTIGSLVLIPVSINLGLRPMLASCLALLLQFLLLDHLRSAKRAWVTWAAGLAGIALIYAVWANMHLGITLGLVSLALAALGDALDMRFRQRAGLPLTGYLALVATAFMASLANPYGWHIYPYIIELSLKSEMNAHIHELMPPNPRNPYVITGMVLLALFVLQWLRKPRHISLGDGLQVVVFGIGTALSLRFVVWAGLYYALVTPPLWGSTIGSARPRPGRLSRGSGYVFLGYGLLGAILLLAWMPWQRGTARIADCARYAGGITELDRRYPADTHWFASEIVGSCTRVYAPGRRVFIDTRFDMYPESFVMAWYYAYQHKQAWRGLFEQWQIDVVLLGNGAPLLHVLSADPQFVQVWQDGQTQLFEKRQRHGRPIAAAPTIPPTVDRETDH